MINNILSFLNPTSIGDAVDKVFTSDEERLQARNVLAKMGTELEKVYASHKSIFVAGARPFALWTASINMISLNMAIVWFGHQVPEWYSEASLYAFGVALGGYGILRTAEKIKGKN